MSIPALLIDGIEVPIQALGDPVQTYATDPGGHALLTMADGSRVPQQYWPRLRLNTQISGGGPAPSGLSAISPLAQVEVACIGPRDIASTSRVIALPAARRMDVTITGQAVVGGEVVATGVAVVGDVATLDAVAGATTYKAIYRPLLTCYCRLEQDVRVYGGQYGWRLDCVEA